MEIDLEKSESKFGKFYHFIGNELLAENIEIQNDGSAILEMGIRDYLGAPINIEIQREKGKWFLSDQGRISELVQKRGVSLKYFFESYKPRFDVQGIIVSPKQHILIPAQITNLKEKIIVLVEMIQIYKTPQHQIKLKDIFLPDFSYIEWPEYSLDTAKKSFELIDQILFRIKSLFIQLEINEFKRLDKDVHLKFSTITKLIKQVKLLLYYLSIDYYIKEIEDFDRCLEIEEIFRGKLANYHSYYLKVLKKLQIEQRNLKILINFPKHSDQEKLIRKINNQKDWLN